MTDPFAGATALMEEGVARGFFPAAVLLAVRDGQPVVHRAFGEAGLDTVFDLASLTKPLCTTAVVMRLVGLGELGLRQRVDRLIPELRRPETRELQVWHLLVHASGLPAWEPLYEGISGRLDRRRRAIRERVARTPLRAPPGQLTCYSDLGFILLEWLLERLTGAPLDRLAQRLVFGPLGLGRTRFVPLRRPGAAAEAAERWPFAPTELCPRRGRRLVAEVHDDNAHALGGVAGHAGLFATAHDVHLLARELVLGHEGQSRLFERRVVRRFWGWPRLPGSTRVLGWDTPGEGSSAGRHFGPGSVGHLGYTGTSLWIDPGRRVWVVLLTNRVFRGREPNPMPRLRPALHDAVMEAMGHY